MTILLVNGCINSAWSTGYIKDHVTRGNYTTIETQKINSFLKTLPNRIDINVIRNNKTAIFITMYILTFKMFEIYKTCKYE